MLPPENLLKHETSPYLLQHANNPVHWRAWNDAALAEAKATNTPILLSIGYAACHWCHVMAHESFEDAPTAGLMNQLFINIKIDREERPDLDAIYQTALAMMGEQGGWPLTMFLTPDGAPFWGGTYFPSESRYGRPAFRDVLAGISEAYRSKPDQVRQNVDALTRALGERAASLAGGAVPLSAIDQVAERISQEIDGVHGGIGGAPKFPQVSILELLWRAHLRRKGDSVGADLGHAVTLTLDRMCQGGIYDHLGGGFSRYSTDARWLVPHFEKMLYDNAQLVEFLTLVWQETKSPLYAARVAETIDWLAREMIAEGGAFAATLDADSEGEEGKYYVWTQDEIDRLLGADAALFNDAYDVDPAGNWEGRTILNRSKRLLLGDPAHEAKLARARAVLLGARISRVPPARDDKVLADWNGLMIAALARAGSAFARPDWIELGARAFGAVVRLLGSPGSDGGAARLSHSCRQGRRQSVAMLDDYADMARAAVALYEASGTPEYLTHARAWVALADRHYWDAGGGGYFYTAEDARDLIARTKHAHDNATPAGNGVMAHVLARLHLLTGAPAYRDRAEAVIGAFSGEIQRNFFPLSTLLNAAAFLARPLQLAIVGAREDGRTEALLRAAATAASLPNLVTMIVPPDAALPDGHPAHGKGLVAGAPAAYVCDGPVCSAPLGEPAALAAELQRR